MEITERAYAKLNLSLDILGKRADGYHEMSMIMQSVDLCDTVHVSDAGEDRISVRTDMRYVPSDSRNIAFRAAEAFFCHAGIRGVSVTIDIEKQIPVCAGTGGGSADGAAVLRAMNVILGTGYDADELREIAEKVGSDVPFCVTGGTYHAGGRGEILTRLPPLPDCYIVIVKPRFSVSTPELFSGVDCRRIRLHPDTEGLTAALRDGNTAAAARRMYNVFEDFLPEGKGEIEEIKSLLIDSGACGAVMTGSGSAVFGIFTDIDCAGSAMTRLSDRYHEVFLTRPLREIDI